MADLHCLICDFRVEPREGNDQVLALLGIGSADAGEELVQHMEAHTLSDWVKAFKMADAYIAQLEGELEQAQSNASALARAPQPVFQAPTPQPGPNGAHMAVLSSAEMSRMSRAEQVRAMVQSADPDQTLIPRIPDAQRPEGVVGVKY